MKEISDGAAFLVDPYSISSIRDAVNKVISNPELRQSKVEKGRLIARSYQNKKIFSEYENLWRQVQVNSKKAAV
jgi:glycosyltransferase involved in cell wall biosynthesis